MKISTAREPRSPGYARAAVAVIALMLGVLGAGCGDDGDSAGQAGSDEISAFQPGESTREGVGPGDISVKPVEGPCKIAVLVAYNIEFFNGVAYGAEQEAKRLGCETDITAARGYGDTTNQLQQFDTALAQQPDGIVIHAADQNAIAPAVDRAWEQGVPLAYASVMGPSDKAMAVLTDDDLAGFQQGQHIGETDPEAKVIAMCGPPGIEWASARCDGLVRGLKETAPKAEVVALKYHEMERGEVAEVAGNTIEAFPDAKWIYNSTDLQATGVVDALQGKGLAPGEINVTTLTIGRETEQLLRSGWIRFAEAERPVLMGALAVDMVVSVLNGETAELEKDGIWEIDQPTFEGAKGADEFCGNSCDDLQSGEVKYNWAPADYQF